MSQDLIDHSTTDVLLAALQDDFYLVVDEYIRSSDELIGKLKHQVAQNADDIDALIILAHTIKGASGNVGAKRVSEICQLLESQLIAGESHLLQQQVDDIEKIYLQTRDEFLRVFKKAC